MIKNNYLYKHHVIKLVLYSYIVWRWCDFWGWPLLISCHVYRSHEALTYVPQCFLLHDNDNINYLLHIHSPRPLTTTLNYRNKKLYSLLDFNFCKVVIMSSLTILGPVLKCFYIKCLVGNSSNFFIYVTVCLYLYND